MMYTSVNSKYVDNNYCSYNIWLKHLCFIKILLINGTLDLGKILLTLPRPSGPLPEGENVFWEHKSGSRFVVGTTPETLEELKTSWRVRDDDVFLVSFPKAGKLTYSYLYNRCLCMYFRFLNNNKKREIFDKNRI